jgi:hypothetical protein
MKAFYSTCEVKETGLTLGALPQGVRSEIDLISLIVEPEYFVAVILKLEIVKTGGIGAEEFKHLTLCEQWPQIHDAGKTVFPNDLDDAEDDRLRTMHGDYVSHLSSPASAILQLPTRHSSTPIDVGRPRIAHG